MLWVSDPACQDTVVNSLHSEQLVTKLAKEAAQLIML